jgi:hypothetical protein
MPQEEINIRVYYNSNYSIVKLSDGDDYTKFIKKIKEKFEIKKQIKCKIVYYTKDLDLEEETFNYFSENSKNEIVEIEVIDTENNGIIISEHDYEFIVEGNSKEKPFELTKQNRELNFNIKHIGTKKYTSQNKLVISEPPKVKMLYDIYLCGPINPQEINPLKFSLEKQSLDHLKPGINELKLNIKSTKIQIQPIVLYIQYNP